MIVALFLSFALTTPPATAVGAEACKSCHPAAYRTWSQSAHARANLTLSAEEKKQVRCTLCHTVDADEPRFAGVQCESCHGNGKYYSPSYVMKDKVLARAVGLTEANEQTCKKCHDASSPSLQPWNFAEAWARIAHGKE